MAVKNLDSSAALTDYEPKIILYFIKPIWDIRIYLWFNKDVLLNNSENLYLLGFEGLLFSLPEVRIDGQ